MLPKFARLCDLGLLQQNENIYSFNPVFLKFISKINFNESLPLHTTQFHSCHSVRELLYYMADLRVH